MLFRSDVSTRGKSKGFPALLFRHQGVNGLCFQGRFIDYVSKVIRFPSNLSSSGVLRNFIATFNAGLVDNVSAIIRALTMGKTYSAEYSDYHNTGDFIPSPNYIEVVTEATRGRSLFFTDENSVGLGPANTLVGDQIWIASPESSPLMLREVHLEAPQFLTLENEDERWTKLANQIGTSTFNSIGDVYLAGGNDLVWKEGSESDRYFICLV